MHLARWLSLAGYLALIALLLVWNIGYAQLPEKIFWIVIGFQLVPLLILAPGVISGNPRGHSWLCFVINIYFIQGVLAAFDPSRAWFGWLEVLITLTLFCSALLYTRWRYQYLRKLAGE